MKKDNYLLIILLAIVVGVVIVFFQPNIRYLFAQDPKKSTHEDILKNLLEEVSEKLRGAKIAYEESCELSAEIYRRIENIEEELSGLDGLHNQKAELIKFGNTEAVGELDTLIDTLEGQRDKLDKLLKKEEAKAGRWLKKYRALQSLSHRYRLDLKFIELASKDLNEIDKLLAGVSDPNEKAVLDSLKGKQKEILDLALEGKIARARILAKDLGSLVGENKWNLPSLKGFKLSTSLLKGTLLTTGLGIGCAACAEAELPTIQELNNQLINIIQQLKDAKTNIIISDDIKAKIPEALIAANNLQVALAPFLIPGVQNLSVAALVNQDLIPVQYRSGLPDPATISSSYQLFLRTLPPSLNLPTFPTLPRLPGR